MMGKLDWNDAFIGVCIVIVVGILTSGTLYGCQRAGDQYYELADKCIRAGGTWVPRGGDYTGLCINARPS